MPATLLLNNGQLVKDKIDDLAPVIKNLKSKLRYLHGLSVHDLVIFFDQLQMFWQKEKLNFERVYLKNLQEFIKRDNLESSLKIALRGNIDALDMPVDLGDSKLLFHAQPRGLSVQWLAGNVPMLGLFSIISALLTKNPCLVKASSTAYEDLIFLLTTLAKVKTDKIDGIEILKCLAVVLVEHSDVETQKTMSLSAETRVVWGGHEIVNLINSLPKNHFCEDIIFGPKYSYALIDKVSLDHSFTKLASRLAVDVAVFDQYACSSPHVVFVETGGSKAPIEFARELAKQLEIVGRTLLPKQSTDANKALEIVNLRSEYGLSGDEVFAPEGTEWTVVYSSKKGLPAGCHSRFIVVKPISDFMELPSLNDRYKQTLAVALTTENKNKLLDEMTLLGVDRCPDIGFATYYESPWDGLFLFDRLVRWVAIYK